MKKFFRNIHLYLSLIAGLFIVLSATTGLLMVFEEEINHVFYNQRYFVTPLEKAKLPLDDLIKAAERANHGTKTSAVKVNNLKDRTVEVSLIAEEKGNQLIKTERSAKKPGFIAYVNPYTGKVISTIKPGDSFFKKVEMLHRFLLSKKGGLGNYVMSYSSLFFLLILITGVILWWPKSNKVLKQRLKVKWNGKPKRLLHDLHVVLGFYASVFLIVIVTTGLIMAFPVINQLMFKLSRSKMESPKIPRSSELYRSEEPNFARFESVVKNSSKNVYSYQFRIPKGKNDAIAIMVLERGELANKAKTYYFDQYSGERLGTLAFADKNLGQRIRSYVKPIHTGEIYGLPTKILSFIICLLTISFPITGVWMWINRLKKAKGAA